MLKKVIKYNDFDGNEREETYYFNLTEAELLEMDMTTEGGMQAMLEQIIQEKDMPKLWQYFERIVKASYGVKSADGKYFDKSPEQLRKFTQCLAYNSLIMELVGDSDAAASFCTGILPKKLAQPTGDGSTIALTKG